MEVITKNADETKKLGQKLAADLVTEGKPLIIALTGDLGSGKTTFVQGFAEELEIKGIISPTFILLRKYKVQSTKYKVKYLYHLDLYRLEGKVEDEVKQLGIEEVWNDPENIVIIEWAEKIKNIIPENSKWISFQGLGDNERKITTL